MFRGDGRENMNAKAEWGIPRATTTGFAIHRNQDGRDSGPGESWDPRGRRSGGGDGVRSQGGGDLRGMKETGERRTS